MMASWKMGYVKVREFKYGPMEPNMKVLGSKTRHQVLENLPILTVMFMKGSGKMIRQMVMVFIHMHNLKLDIRVIGKTICKTVLEYKCMKMAINILEIFNKVNAMEKALTHLQMKQYLKDHG